MSWRCQVTLPPMIFSRSAYMSHCDHTPWRRRALPKSPSQMWRVTQAVNSARTAQSVAQSRLQSPLWCGRQDHDATEGESSPPRDGGTTGRPPSSSPSKVHPAASAPVICHVQHTWWQVAHATHRRCTPTPSSFRPREEYSDSIMAVNLPRWVA